VYPGTKLNLVVGPNGAGKSTIVGAMVLGLGFPLKVRPAPRPPASVHASSLCFQLPVAQNGPSARRARCCDNVRAPCADDAPVSTVPSLLDYEPGHECRGLDQKRRGGR
jgi:hypothetical protein